MPRKQNVVYIHETGEVFLNILDVAKSLGVDHSDLSKHIRGLKIISWLSDFHITICSEKFCRVCEIILTKNNTYPSQLCKQRICKECEKQIKIKGYKKRKDADPVLHKFVTYNQNHNGEFTLDELRNLYLKQNEKCKLCEIIFEKGNFHLDHIVSKSCGGSDKIDNIQFLCKKCNMGKWDWTQTAYIEHCKRVAENN